MRKLGIFFITLLLTLTLVACNKTKLTASVRVKDFDSQGIGTDALNIEIELFDPNDEIEQNLKIYLLEDKNGKFNKKDKLQEKTRSKEELEDDNSIRFSSLKGIHKYQLNIDVAVGGKNHSLFSQEFTTRANEVYEINTPEEFLKIKENPYGTYNLRQSIDFTGLEKEISSSLIGSFRGNFHGHGNTISNYTIESTNSSLGLFGQLSSKAVVEDLTVDNLQLTKKFPNSTSGTSSYVGVLFGQNSSSTVKVRNITIKNSKLDLEIDSSSNYLKFGLLGGTASGKFDNIVIEDNNTMDLKFKRHAQVYVGGVVGELSSTSEFTNIKNDGTINLEVDQQKYVEKVIEGSEEKELVVDPDAPSESGLVAKEVFIYVGGFAGTSRESIVKNVITNTDITVNKLDYSVETNGDDEKDKAIKYISLYVGGLFGSLSSPEVSDMIYGGNINVTESFTFTNNLKEILKDEEGNDLEDENGNPVYGDPIKLRNKYVQRLYVGGLIGSTSRRDTSIFNLVRTTGNITIANQNEEVKNSLGNLFGHATNITYLEDNLFGIFGNVDDTYNDEVLSTDLANIRIIESLEEFFKNNEWILNNIK